MEAAHKAAKMGARKALRCARIFRMLCPQPQRTAKTASPMVPLSGHRARRPSVFMWPISGSIALRHRSSRFSVGVRPRRVPLIRTRVVDTPATISAVDDGKRGHLARQDFDLFQRLWQSVAVIGISRQGPHADDEAFIDGGGEADLGAELVPLAGLAFRDAVDRRSCRA